jgi:ABC-2 type transport system ATP-binding protein
LTPSIETRKLNKVYGNYKALDNLSFNIPKGSVFGLLGPNGAGKTSLIRIITQITAPDSGEVLFEGQPLGPQHISRIGYLPEERGLYKKSKVGEQLLYFAQLKGMSRQEALDRAKDWFVRLDIKDWWNKNVEDLSKGMAQKLQFIVSVIHQPEFIILDEPFSGFDPVNSDIIRDEILRLHSQGATILFSTHRMETVEELCSHIMLLNKSRKVLEGSVKQVRSSFKTNEYSAITRSEIDFSAFPWEPVPEMMNIESDQGWKSSFRIPIERKSNELVLDLIQVTELVSFSENLPGFHEIFKQVVGKQNASQ